MTDTTHQEPDPAMIELLEKARRKSAELGIVANLPVTERLRLEGLHRRQQKYRMDGGGTLKPLGSIATALIERSPTTSPTGEGSESADQQTGGCTDGRSGAIVTLATARERARAAALAATGKNQPLPGDNPVSTCLLNTPLTDQELNSLVAELDVLTRKPAGETEEAAAMRLITYRNRLRDYDGEAVRTAISQWPDRNAWWPSWADLRAAILDVWEDAARRAK